MPTLSLARARRLVLTSLGLARGRPAADRRRDVRHLRGVLERVRVVQLDSVQVLARAHELPFWSRLGAHDRAARDRWLWRSGELYEGWIHVASLAPVEVWPWLHHRRAATRRPPRLDALLGEDPYLLDRVHDEVAERGPLTVSDLTQPGSRTGPWWGNPAGKVALDHLARTGRLAVHDRGPGFVTAYDLPERVLPAAVLDTDPPGPERAHELLLQHALSAQGLGTVHDLADHHRLALSPAAAALTRMVARGEVAEVRVAGWGSQPVYLDPDAVTARESRARTLLSPFDPAVWYRDRAERLLGFHYRIEIYTPAHRRVHGYYVLPFLLGDRVVGRVDLKADRATGRLLVRSAFPEPGVDRPAVARELAAELRELARWLALVDVICEDGAAGELVGPLARALERS